MYENTKSSIDWKGIFLKVIIAFLIVLIAVTGYKTLKGDKKDTTKTTTKIVESNASTTFTANMEKLKEAGETYYNTNKDKLPTEAGVTSMVTLTELISNGVITSLTNEDGKACDGESSYVTAVKSGDKYTIKANLVCGDSSSYATTYLGENDSEVKEETVSTKTSNTSSKKTYTEKTYTNSNKTNTNTCGTSCTPSVSISTNTKVEQNVSINKDNTSSNNNTVKPSKNYLVTFEENGGSCYYNSKYVKEGNKVNYPGDCEKSNYVFKGWYLNGSKYNFDTPIYEDIILEAKYERRTSNNNGYYSGNGKYTDTVDTYVYTMGWDDAYINRLTINHTLKVDEALNKIENKGIDEDDVTRIRIKDINYTKSINTPDLAATYERNHSRTFFYQNSGWESHNTNSASLATVGSNVYFLSNKNYKYISNALYEGFDVTWTANSISRSCKTPFAVINGNDIVYNKCNFGIVYKVTWEYEYYA